MNSLTDSERISGIKISDLSGNSFGYVVLPKDIERDTYIKQCSLNNKIHIYDNILKAFIGEAMITDQILNDITFPNDVNSFGSAVVISYMNLTATPICIGTLKNKKSFEDIKEGSFKISKTFNGGLVEISGDSKTGELNLNTVGVDKPSSLNINVLGKNESTLNINVSGKTKIKTSTQTTIEDSFGNFIEIVEKGISLTDSFKNTVNLTENGVVLSVEGDKKIFLGSDSSDKSSVIGEELTSVLKDLLSAIKSITVPTPSGPSGPPVNVLQFEAISTTIDKILSKVVLLK